MKYFTGLQIMNKSPWEKKSPHDGEKHVQDFIKNFQDKMKTNFKDPKNSPSKNFIIMIILIIFGIWLMTGFFILNEGEQAVITRFGRFSRIATAGPNYHLPTPIEDIIKCSVDRVEKIEIGFSSGNSVIQSKKPGRGKNLEESLMLTVDENILDINFVVQYRVNNIKDYIFNIQSPTLTVKSAAESAMREVIGSTTMAEALTSGRAAAEQKVSKLVQQVLNSYKSGVEIVSLQMLNVDPPEQVIDSFRDVQTARADKEREINQAQAYYNDVIPRARGQAAEFIQRAEGYKQAVVSSAEGQSGRFISVYNQYKLAKDVTKKRLYIETMEEILKDMNKIIVPKENSTLQLLNLDKLNFKDKK